MSSKTKDSYVRLFQAVKDKLPAGRRQGPLRFSADFELPSIDAFLETFPASTPQCCYFHFTQSMWRKAQESGVAAPYRRRDDEVALRSDFHAILGLPFVPTDQVPEGLSRPFINWLLSIAFTLGTSLEPEPKYTRHQFARTSRYRNDLVLERNLRSEMSRHETFGTKRHSPGPGPSFRRSTSQHHRALHSFEGVASST